MTTRVGVDRTLFKTPVQIGFYIRELRAHAMCRATERLEDWPDYAAVAARLSEVTQAPARSRRGSRRGSLTSREPPAKLGPLDPRKTPAQLPKSGGRPQ